MQFIIPIQKSLEKNILPIYEKDLIIPLTKQEKQNVTLQSYFPEEINAPVKEKQEVGKVQFLLNDEILGEVKLLCPKNRNKESNNNRCYYPVHCRTYNPIYVPLAQVKRK